MTEPDTAVPDTVVPASPESCPIVSTPVSARLPLPVRVTAASSRSASPSVARLPPETPIVADAIEPAPVSVSKPPFTVVLPV